MSRFVRALLLCSGLLALRPTSIQAQELPLRFPPRWRLTGELAALSGGIWLRGPGIPTVSNDVGVVLGVGAQRGVGEHASAGAMLRVGQQSVKLEELDSRWDGGTLTEADVLGTVSLHSRSRTAFRLSVDLAAGAAILSGINDVQPFPDASSLSPVLEVGLSLRRGAVDDDASRRDIGVLLRYSALRLDMLSVGAEATSGWVGRVMAGLRVTR